MLFALLFTATAFNAFQPAIPGVQQQVNQGYAFGSVTQPVSYVGLRGTVPAWTKPASHATPAWMLLALTGVTAGAATVATLYMRGGMGYGYGGYGPFRGSYGGYGGGYGGYGGGYGRYGGYRQRYGGIDDYSGSRTGWYGGYGGYGHRGYTDQHIDETGPHSYMSQGEYLASPDYGFKAARSTGSRPRSVASHRSRGFAPYLDSPYYSGDYYNHGGANYYRSNPGYGFGGYGGYGGYGGRMLGGYGGYGMGRMGMGSGYASEFNERWDVGSVGRQTSMQPRLGMVA